MTVLALSLNEWLRLLESRHPRTIDLGLERSREVWERMGSPRPAGQIFTVAGTNGKGSTVACLCGMLRALGYSFGTYTTPHLFRYNERIQINGVDASDGQLIDAFERVEAARGDVSLSYFEFGTLAAILLMNEAGLDFASSQPSGWTTRSILVMTARVSGGKKPELSAGIYRLSVEKRILLPA